MFFPQVFAEKIKEFDGNIFEKYIEYRGDPLIGSIEQGMLLGEYRWEDNVTLEGIKSSLYGSLAKQCKFQCLCITLIVSQFKEVL